MAHWLAPATLTVGLLLFVSPAGAHRGALRASAALSPHAQFLGDSAGTVFTFTVTNAAGSRRIGAVQIALPSRFWLVMACPQAPAGWVAQTDEQGCRYENRAGAAGDIAPGASSSAFQMTAGTWDGASNQTGTFKVSVGSAPKAFRDGDDDDDERLTEAPAAYPGGLDVTAFSFQRPCPLAGAHAADEYCPGPPGDVGFSLVCANPLISETREPRAVELLLPKRWSHDSTTVVPARSLGRVKPSPSCPWP